MLIEYNKIDLLHAGLGQIQNFTMTNKLDNDAYPVISYERWHFRA